MCGIAGVVNYAGADGERIRAATARMCDELSHRGPDDWGVKTLHGDTLETAAMGIGGRQLSARHLSGGSGPSVSFGHRRLSIIDLTPGGHQPMATPDGRFWITYNGEIYNYLELRERLEAQGVSFRSRSDTEVLLQLYALEGPDCLGKIRGMFAFAIWDDQDGELFIARDRFGIKPLYYVSGPGPTLAFASELRPLLAAGFSSNDLDTEAEYQFLRHGSIRAPRTIYRGIKALPPACHALWRGREVRVEKYWSLDAALGSGPPTVRDVSEVAERVRAELIESVRAHMVSDVPVGLFLSGGLDSTAILSAARQCYGGRLRTFTLAFPGTPWDEGAPARRAADLYGTEHTEGVVTKEDFFLSFDRFFAAIDQPTVDGVNTFFVAEVVRQGGHKVALSGVGGDEVLGGYSSFAMVPRLAKWVRQIRRVPLLGGAAAGGARHLRHGWSPKLVELLAHSDGAAASVWQSYRSLFTDEQIRLLGFRDDRPQGASSSDLMQSYDADFRLISRLELERFLIPQLLRDSDVFTMCHGLELRTPFVDHVFLEGVADAGAWERSGAVSYKAALFEHMRGLVPDGHARLGKKGFVLPFDTWLREELSDGGRAKEADDLRRRMRVGRFRGLLNGFLAGRVHWSRVWALYVLERFKETA